MKKHSVYAKALHWALAFSVLAVLTFFVDGDEPHRYLGYFASFIGLCIFIKNVKNQQKSISDHSNLAIWVHRFILFFVVALSVSGFMMSLDAFWGEDWVEKLHLYTSNLLVSVIILHFLGIIRDSYLNQRKTWMHMIGSLNENQK